MRTFLLYILVISYSVVILKPVIPTLADITAHVFWYSEHVATVHYEHGKYHVHLEYANAAKKGQSEKNNSLNAYQPFNQHVNTVWEYLFTPPPVTSKKYGMIFSPLTDMPQGRIYPPPRIA